MKAGGRILPVSIRDETSTGTPFAERARKDRIIQAGRKRVHGNAELRKPKMPLIEGDLRKMLEKSLGERSPFAINRKPERKSGVVVSR